MQLDLLPCSHYGCSLDCDILEQIGVRLICCHLHTTAALLFATPRQNNVKPFKRNFVGLFLNVWLVRSHETCELVSTRTHTPLAAHAARQLLHFARPDRRSVRLC